MWFKYIGLCILAILLIFLGSAPARGQLIDLKSILRQTSDVNAKRIGNIDVANVSLDGRNLFLVTAPAPETPDQDVTPIAWRVQEIKFKLQKLIKNRLEPDTLKAKVEHRNQQTVIVVEDQNMEAPKHILTITERDAFIDVEENTIPKTAERRAKIIETALRQAWKERQPDYRQQQLRYSALVLLGMGVGFVALTALQRYRHHRHQLVVKSQQQQQAEVSQLQSQQDNNTVELDSDQHLEDDASHGKRWLPIPSLRIPSLTWEQQELINRSVRYLLAVLKLAIIFVGSAWILNRFPETRPFGSWLLTLPLSLILIPIAVILVKDIVDWIIVLSLDRWVELREETQTLSNRFRLRIQTLLNVLKDLTSQIAWLIGLLLFFRVINALPIGLILLAVVAFTSQNLLKDWLRGAFILIEDHYAKGDIVAIGSIRGKVEFINLRVTQLRTVEGKLVSIDNGSFTQVENLTSQWSGIRLIIGVAYKTNLDQAKEVIGQVAQDMEKDPDCGQYLIEAPQILGVEDFGENSIQIALLIKTETGKQFEAGREYRRRLKPAFDRAGISIPFPKRSIWFENTLPPKPPAS